MAKVLVVDDAAFMRMRCKKLLTQSGFEVVEAATGAQAVEMFQSDRPDMVLLDITMPDMDGLAALKEIKKIDPDARVAMVTAMGQQSMVMEALKAGARDFVIKPFDQDSVGKPHSLACQSIDVRSVKPFIPLAMKVHPSQVVDHDHQNVGRVIGRVCD